MMEENNESKGKYLRFLPSIFHEKAEDGAPPFIERYLKIFEKILSGIDDNQLKGKKGIGEMLDIMADLFYPRFSFLFEDAEPEEKRAFMPTLEDNHKEIFKTYFSADLDEFLKWLAGWMALVLKEDWGLNKKREVIAKIIPIYRMRGTKTGIMKFLSIYVGNNVEVFEEMGSFRIGSAKIGVESLIGGGIRPHFFTVKLSLPVIEREEQLRTIRNLKNILDLEKPVHTSYLLKITAPAFQIGKKEGAIIGQSTLLGGTFEDIET